MDHFANDPYNASAHAQAAANTATSEARYNKRELDQLKARVNALENTVSDLLRVLSQDGIIEVQPPKE